MTENLDPSRVATARRAVASDVLPILASISSSQFDSGGGGGGQNDRIRNAGGGASLFSPGANRMAPLAGKKIFMHYDSGTLSDHRIEGVLRKLKADLVDFFSRDVHYIITNRPTNRIPSMSENSSPVPDKQGQQQHVMAKSTPVLMKSTQRTPQLTANAFNSGRISVGTRGSAMLAMAARKAKMNSQATVEMRPSPNPSSVLRQSIGRADSDFDSTELPEDPERDRACQVRLLRTPCIKIVDSQRQYRPLYLDHTDYLPSLWNLVTRTTASRRSTDATLARDGTPILENATPPLTPQRKMATGPPLQPFLPPSTNQSIPTASLGHATPHRLSHAVTPATGTPTPSLVGRRTGRAGRQVKRRGPPGVGGQTPAAGTLCRSASIPTKLVGLTDGSKPVVAEEEPPGYCECCAVSFVNLMEHLKSPDHLQFAENNENYRLLDDVLGRLPTLDVFLASRPTTHLKLGEPSQPASSVSQKRRRRPSRAGCPNDANASAVATGLTVPERQRKKGKPNTRSPSPQPPSPTVNSDRAQPTCPPILSLTHANPNPPGEETATLQRPSVRLFSDDEDEEMANLHPVIVEQETPVEIPEPVQELPPIPSNHLLPVIHSDPSMENSIVVSMTLEPTTEYDCADQPLQISDAAWRCARGPVYMNVPAVDIALEGAIPHNAESPVLEPQHLRCITCHRAHIPVRLPLDMHLRVNCLFGPRNPLHGVGCDGPKTLPPSSSCSTPFTSSLSETEIVDEVDTIVTLLPVTATVGSPSPHLPPLPQTAPSPVFETLDETLPTSPMRHSTVCSISDESLTRPSDSHVVAFPTNHSNSDDPPSNSRSVPAMTPHCNSQSPPAWLSQNRSFECTITANEDDSLHEDGCSIIDISSSSVSLNDADGTFETPKFMALPSSHHSGSSSSFRRIVVEDPTSQTHRTPPPVRRRISVCTPESAPRSHRQAARVARESISLSVQALFSPSTMNRLQSAQSPPSRRQLSKMARRGGQMAREVVLFPNPTPASNSTGKKSLVARRKRKRYMSISSSPESEMS